MGYIPLRVAIVSLASPAKETHGSHTSLEGVATVAEMVNFYDELGLETDWSVSIIQEKLRQLKRGFQAKAMRGTGSLLEVFKRKLELIPRAEEAFKDEDSRDRYDIMLKRADAPDAPPQTDWLEKAWIYYDSGDEGAALIAARKAKETFPDHPMAYVVSAYVWLKENEPKQAKRDADEAFVLGEHGADLVDVLEVRAAVYIALKEYGRAIASLDSAIRQANESAKPELYLRKAETHLILKQSASAYEAARDGLSPRFELSDTVRRGLQSTAIRAISRAVDARPVTAQIEGYSHYLTELAFAPIDQDSKIRIIANIRENIDRCKRRTTFQAERDRLAQFRYPEGTKPDVPWLAILTAVIALAVSVIAFRFSSAFGMLALAVAVGSVIYSAVIGGKRSEWTGRRAEHESAQKALESIDRELRNLQHADQTSPAWRLVIPGEGGTNG